MTTVQAVSRTGQPYRFPPGPEPVPGNILSQINFWRNYQKDPIANMTRMFEDYGDAVHMQIGDEHMVLLSHPDHIRTVLVTSHGSFHKGRDYKDEKQGLARFMGNGLVTSDGEFWRRQRKLVQPAFHTKRIEAYAETMVDYTLRQIADWQDGEARDIDEEMMRLTLLIVGKTLFDADASGDAQRVGEVMHIFQHMSSEIDLVPQWIPTPLHLKQQGALRDMDEIIYGYINARRGKDEDRGDLLSMLLAASGEDGGMTDKQVRDEALTLFLAGHETTANALNWTWYLLQQNPAAEARLHDELDAVLAGRAPNLDDLKQLPYTEMVIKESMRLLPPVPFFGRQAIEDVEIGDYHIPAGSGVSVFVHRTHHHPELWEEPEAFRPERFSPENEATISRYAYVPFGGGPRICIGNSFAMMEAHLLLATIAQRFRLRLAPEARVVPEPLVTLRPRHGLKMTIHRR